MNPDPQPRIIVRAFEPEDYVAIQAGTRLVEDPTSVGHAFHSLGPAYTAWSHTDDRLACAGLAIEWPGRAFAWAVLAPGLRSDPYAAIAFHWRVRRRLHYLMVEHGLRRVEVDVNVRSGDGIRWLRTLGFQLEAKMLGYGLHGESFFKFVRLPPGFSEANVLPMTEVT